MDDVAHDSPAGGAFVRALVELAQPLTGTRPHPLAGTGTLAGTGNLPADLHRTECRHADHLAATAVTVLGVGCAAVLVADENGAPTVLAGSDDTARALLGIEAATGAGPAIDCTRAGRAQNVIVDAARDRWPPWAEAAGRGGWRTAAAVPLRTRERTVGGLVLLRAAGSVCPGDDALAQAHALASVAACALVQYRERCRLQLRSDQLQAALTTRVAIEQAKGVLAERGGIDVQAAFDRLRAYARARRRPLADVAREVVTGELADAVLTQVPPLRRRPQVADPRSPA